MKKIHLVSLGCAKNLVDSEQMLAMFDDPHFCLTDNPEEADLIIVNTCGFINSAKKESIDKIFEMASYKGKIAVTGCLSTRYEKELKEELKEVDAIISIDDYQTLNKAFGELLEEEGVKEFNPLRRNLTTTEGTAYIRISEGCDNFCAFCAIPHIRGRFVSRPFEEILEDARILKEKGIKEISLISQDTTVYGKDFPKGKPNLIDLLDELEKMGFFSIRLLYLYPSEISDELIHKIADSKVIAHYFDIPVQAASDHLLTLMRRHADAKETIELFHRIKRICPDAILRTTLISGFPEETEEDQEETKRFLNDIEFDHVGVFVYSPEENTPGYYMTQIDEEIKERRKEELMKLQRPISYKKNKERVGKEDYGLILGQAKDGKYVIRSSVNAPDDIDGAVYASSKKPHLVGEIVKIKYTHAFVYDLLAEILD